MEVVFFWCLSASSSRSSSDFLSTLHCLWIRPLSWPGGRFLSRLPPRPSVEVTLASTQVVVGYLMASVFSDQGSNIQVLNARCNLQLEEWKANSLWCAVDRRQEEEADYVALSLARINWTSHWVMFELDVKYVSNSLYNFAKLIQKIL